MVAKIAGIGPVVWEAVLAFALIVPVLGSLFAAVFLAVDWLDCCRFVVCGVALGARRRHAGKVSMYAVHTRRSCGWI